MFTQKKNLLIKKKKYLKKKRKTDQKNRRYFEKISGQLIEKCGAILWLIIMFQFILMIYTRFHYLLCLQLFMNCSPLCFRFVRYFVQEHLTDISLSVCVCVADEGERKMKKLNEMNRFWILFNLEEICLPMLFMCCNYSFNGRAISQQESNVIKIYFTRDIDSVFFFHFVSHSKFE